MTRTTAVTTAPVEGAELAPARKAKFLEAFTGAAIRADQQTAFLLALGEHLGLRPELGEIMFYQGKPYITFDGRVRMAHQSGMLDGLEVRPASQHEYRNYGKDGVVVWVATAYRRGSSRTFTGWGEAGGPTDNNPISKNFPSKMAKKRAKYDALRAAFPAAEEITPLHQQYIEAAEAEARQFRAEHAPKPLAAGYDALADDEDDDAGEEAGHDAAADAGDAVNAAQGSSIPDDEPAPNADRAPAATIAIIRKLMADKKVTPVTRLRVETRLTAPMTMGVAKTIIAQLESEIAPKDASATMPPSGAPDELDLGDAPRSTDAIRQGR